MSKQLRPATEQDYITQQKITAMSNIPDEVRKATFIYKQDQLTEKATMLHPHDWIRSIGNEESYSEYCEQYANHKQSLRKIPCSPECRSAWKEGYDVTNKFYIGADDLAYPIQKEQESEDELYDEIETIFDKHTAPTGGGYEADYTDRNGFINELIKTFQLTRRKQ